MSNLMNLYIKYVILLDRKGEIMIYRFITDEIINEMLDDVKEIKLKSYFGSSKLRGPKEKLVQIF